MKKILIYWVAISFIITVIFGTIYATTQQVLRQDANDPQIQMAEDISAQIGRSVDPRQFITTQVDVANSLAPFVIIYNSSGHITNSSALLDGTIPQLPQGVLTNAKPQNRVTWQPREGVRIAAVVQASNTGYVLAGRNLREVENRENKIFALSAFGWLVSEFTITSFVAYKLRFKSNAKKPKVHKK